MNISLDAALLAGMLREVTQTVYDNPNRPILGAYRIHASDERIQVAGTDLEITAVVEIPATQQVRVTEPGYVAVEGDKLDAIVKQCRAGELLTLTSDVERQEVLIVVSGASWTLRTLSVEDYPNLPDFASGISWDVPRAELLRALQHCVGFVAQDDTRRQLTMVMFQDGYALATNGVQFGAYRMAMPLDGLAIPRGALKALMILLAESEANMVCVQQQESHLLFVLDGGLFAVRLLDVQPPNIAERILGGSDALPYQFVTSRREFVEALNRVYVIRNEAAGVMLCVADAPGMLELSTHDERGNRSWARITVNTQDELPTRGQAIGLNAAYLCNILGLLEGEGLCIRYGTGLIDGKRPPIRIEEDSFVGVLMQLRTADVERNDGADTSGTQAGASAETG